MQALPPLANWPAGQVSATAVHEVAVRGALYCVHFASALGGHGHSGAPEPEGRWQGLIFPKSMKGRLPEDRSLPYTKIIVTSTNAESDRGSAPWRLELGRLLWSGRRRGGWRKKEAESQ